MRAQMPFPCSGGSTVLIADMIAVVDKGRIVERGTHKELLEEKGIYSKLVSRQQSKEKEKLNIDELIDDLRNGDDE